MKAHELMNLLAHFPPYTEIDATFHKVEDKVAGFVYDVEQTFENLFHKKMSGVDAIVKSPSPAPEAEPAPAPAPPEPAPVVEPAPAPAPATDTTPAG